MVERDNTSLTESRTRKGFREDVPVNEKARHERLKDGISKGIFHPTIIQITFREGIISFHFIFTSFWRVTLQHCWFSRGPPLKEKQYIYTAKIQ